ncbi:CBS domain-containing protein [Falsiroseomonas sp.]|uniref:CBS domain-containing protein n=1 Tax=Falsiroseomonas sp. TaxID=2870721 RepID=UPI003562E2A1
MAALRARDVMTTGGVTVAPETPVAAVARMFADRGLSAATVTDASGTLLGIVTESDLIRRLADEDDQPSGWLARLFDGPFSRAERYARSHGVYASELMTTPVVTVGPEEGVAHVARLMEEHHIRRIPVAEDGRLLGLISRSDLVRALVAQQPTPAGELSDDEIHRGVIAAMRRASWADTVHAAVHVQDGVVEFYGYSPSETVSRALRVLAENVPGVKGVVDRTRHRFSGDPS